MPAGRRRFSTLLRADLASSLHRNLGIAAPNRMQAEALGHALAGRDLLLQAQTGSGKTLVLVLPPLQRAPRAARQPEALVVVPTEALAQQHLGVIDAIASPTDGGRLAVGSAEALLRRVDAGELDLGGLRTIAVDEADAVLCGAPGPGVALLEAAAAAAAPAPLQRIFAAAHLTDERLIELVAHLPADHALLRHGFGAAGGGVLVPTCRQVYHFFTAAKAKADVLLRVLRSAAGDARDGVADGATLVFCADGVTAEEVRARLAAELPADAPVAALHAATTADDRRGALALFGAPDARGVLVADGLATRGLDLPGVRHVVLYDLPTDVTTYVHAAGRTARRGEAGLVTCLVQNRGQQQAFSQFHSHLALQRAESAWT